jgi:hypothetical protein
MVAHWMALCGDADEAVAALTVLLAEQRHMLRPDHPDTERTAEELERWCGTASG